MAGICFFFERNDADVWSGRRIDFDAWNYAIKAAGDIDRVLVINKTDIDLKTFDADIDFSVVSELPDLDGKVATLCTPRDSVDEAVSLWDFEHNVDWYLFGPANGWRRHIDGLGVFIPVSGLVDLHAVHVASVVMTHRYGVKSWR